MANDAAKSGRSQASLGRGGNRHSSGREERKDLAGRGQKRESSQRELFRNALKAKGGKISSPRSSYSAKGRGPNKAAGSKGGIRRQGSKR